MKVEVELQPFTVPNFVLVKPRLGFRQEGITEAPKFALSELDEQTLEQLCAEFRRAVFAKAGKAVTEGATHE
jgi:CRISPR/Cas system endoribonuclease Cas6 (RAMP superfamily)